MNVAVEITFWRDATYRGFAHVTARITEDCCFYTGTGDTPLEAIAWAMHEYVSRRLLDMPHMMARNADSRPGDGLEAAPSSRSRSVTLTTIAAYTAPEHASGKDEIACFERRIPTSPAPRLFTDIATSNPATRSKRRARGGR